MAEKKISTISKIYANALLEACSDCRDLIKAQLYEVLEVISSSQDLNIVMADNSISPCKKNDILDKIFGDKVDNRIINLLKILSDKNRFGEISSIYEAYEEILNSRSNKKNVEIISSIDLDENMKNKITERLQNKLNCEILPDWHVDENIIAGLNFKFDDYVIDASVRTKLEKLSKNI